MYLLTRVNTYAAVIFLCVLSLAMAQSCSDDSHVLTYWMLDAAAFSHSGRCDSRLLYAVQIHYYTHLMALFRSFGDSG